MVEDLWREISIDMTSTRSAPRGINPKTGRPEYTEEQLRVLKPLWRGQWERYSHLDPAVIDKIVNEVHTGPFQWPGTNIMRAAEIKTEAMLRRLAKSKKWSREDSRKMYREAKKMVNEELRKFNDAYGYKASDPWGYLYFIPEAGRKKLRRREGTYARA